jgi:hypothetical protein
VLFTDVLVEAIIESGWLAILAGWAQQTVDVALTGEAERALANIDSAALRVRLGEMADRKSRGACYRTKVQTGTAP